MAVQDYKINYKSDFVLNINGDAGWAIPFCIKFWTGMPSQAYFVGFDGVKYVNCRVGDTPTQLLVMFDDHHLPIGKLEMQIAYHTTIEEFPGSVFDEVTNARDVIVTIDGTDYQVMLDFTGEDTPELEFDLPAYANEAERIQNELQRQQNEAARIEAELEREQASAAAVAGAENVNAQLSGTTLTVTNRQGVSTSVNTKGEQGEQGPVGPQGEQGEQGETGISIVSFLPKSETSTTLIYTVTFSDGHTQDVPIPKGAKGDTGATGPQGQKGDTGVSITAFTYASETETNMIYTVIFSDSTTQQVAIPKGAKGDTGPQGPAGPTGPQGPMGDVAVITPEQQAAFTMYSTTGQNTNGPMTQKAVTDATSFQGQQVNLSQYATKNCSIGATTWYENNTHTKGKHKAIPVSVGDRFRLISSPSAFYGWLTSAYTGTTPSNGDDVPYVSGTTRQGKADGIIEAPEGAAYLCLTVVSGAGDSITNTLYKIYSIRDYLESSDSVPTQDSDKLVISGGIYSSLDARIPKSDTLETYLLSDYDERSCSLGPEKWYENQSTHYGKHKAIPVTALNYYNINGRGFVGWVGQSYGDHYEEGGTPFANGDTVPYVAGTTRKLIPAGGGIIQAPKNAAFLIVCTYDGSGNATTITEVSQVDAHYDELKNFEDYIGDVNDQYNAVDLLSFDESPGVLNGNSATWYTGTGFSHIAVPVVAGEEYLVRATSTWFSYGLLQSYSGTSSNPVYSTSSPQRITVGAKALKISIPSDCTYVVFTARSNGTYVLPDLMCKLKMLPWALERMTLGGDVQVKLTYAHWNVGHFSYYDQNVGGNNTTISGADSDTMALRYKTMINKVSPDIFGICEYNPEFDLDGGLAKNLIFQNYKYQFIGEKKGYPCNSVFSNFKGVEIEQVPYTQHSQDTYYHSTRINIGGTNVYVVETHMDWNSSELRDSQIAQLIAAFASNSYVIISGDFNTGNASQYQAFVDAGYTLANGGYVGLLPTYLKHLYDDTDSNDNALYLDNIITKGFAMSNIKVWDESGYVEGGLSDHSIISCDLLLLP